MQVNIIFYLNNTIFRVAHPILSVLLSYSMACHVRHISTAAHLCSSRVAGRRWYAVVFNVNHFDILMTFHFLHESFNFPSSLHTYNSSYSMLLLGVIEAYFVAQSSGIIKLKDFSFQSVTGRSKPQGRAWIGLNTVCGDALFHFHTFLLL